MPNQSGIGGSEHVGGTVFERRGVVSGAMHPVQDDGGELFGDEFFNVDAACW
jgi:hypothetical protein